MLNKPNCIRSHVITDTNYIEGGMELRYSFNWYQELRLSFLQSTNKEVIIFMKVQRTVRVNVSVIMTKLFAQISKRG